MSSLDEIEAVTFDAGGTLFEPWPSVGHVYAEAAAAHGATGISPERLNERFARVWKERKDFNYTRADWSALVDLTFEGLAPEPPSRSFFPGLYERFSTAGAWRVFDDALPILGRLRGMGVKLGLISNWDERLRPLLGELGLSEVFDAVVISAEAGVCKPDPRIFQTAARNMSVPLASMLHVGDSRKEDFEGARGAGAKSLLLCRTGAGADGVIQSLADIATRARAFAMTDGRLRNK